MMLTLIPKDVELPEKNFDPVLICFLLFNLAVRILDLVWLVLGVQGRKGKQQVSSWPSREVKAAIAHRMTGG